MRVGESVVYQESPSQTGGVRRSGISDSRQRKKDTGTRKFLSRTHSDLLSVSSTFSTQFLRRIKLKIRKGEGPILIKRLQLKFEPFIESSGIFRHSMNHIQIFRFKHTLKLNQVSDGGSVVSENSNISLKYICSII